MYPPTGDTAVSTDERSQHLNRRTATARLQETVERRAQAAQTQATDANWREHHQIVRKGAVSAQDGEQIVVPVNMRDGALVCTGLGNPEWNYSAPHGAGRLMSRSEVKQHYTVSAYKKAMVGVFSSTIDAGTLDECPMAYKDLDEIVARIGPTARIDRHIRTVYNFKGGDDRDGRSPRRHQRPDRDRSSRRG